MFSIGTVVTGLCVLAGEEGGNCVTVFAKLTRSLVTFCNAIGLKNINNFI